MQLEKTQLPIIFQGSKDLRLSAIISNDSPAIAVLRKVDEKMLNTHIDAMIIQVASIFKLNENKTFTDAEILEATNLLKANFYFLKWDDLLLFVQQVKLGRYNDIYNRWDMPTFFQMLQRYCDERAEISTSLNRVKHEERKKEPISEETQRKINKFKSNMIAIKINNISTIQPKQTEVDNIVNEWIKEFNEIYRKNPQGTGFRIIDYKGKKVDINQYLVIKNKEYEENN